MYHCQLHFYLIGRMQGIYGTLKKIPPLERFTHIFLESDTAEGDLITKADVIFADLHTVNIPETLAVLDAKKRKIHSLFYWQKRSRCLFCRSICP